MAYRGIGELDFFSVTSGLIATLNPAPWAGTEGGGYDNSETRVKTVPFFVNALANKT